MLSIVIITIFTAVVTVVAIHDWWTDNVLRAITILVLSIIFMQLQIDRLREERHESILSQELR